MFRAIKKHTRIINALILREMITRYGREGIGFLWVVGEPLLFCLVVMGLWTLAKPEYEHGIRVAPFVMTGYMAILLFRHIVSSSSGALLANIGILHHQIVRPLHLFIARAIQEIFGGALAFLIVYVVLMMMGAVTPPHNYLIIYYGYFIMGWISTGFGMSVAALSIRYEVLERVLPVTMYIMIPLSGAFFMVDWIPEQYRSYYLLNPLPHAIEMIRSGVFGEFVPTHFDMFYPVAWAIGLTLSGLLLLAQTQRYLDIE